MSDQPAVNLAGPAIGEAGARVLLRYGLAEKLEQARLEWDYLARHVQPFVDDASRQVVICGDVLYQHDHPCVLLGGEHHCEHKDGFGHRWACTAKRCARCGTPGPYYKRNDSEVCPACDKAVEQEVVAERGETRTLIKLHDGTVLGWRAE